jgi:hypothetical protein
MKMKRSLVFIYIVWVEPGQYQKIPAGRKDDTHLNEKGAIEVAALAVEAMREIKTDLINYLKK